MSERAPKMVAKKPGASSRPPPLSRTERPPGLGSI
jgi:hypothetical protein